MQLHPPLLSTSLAVAQCSHLQLHRLYSAKKPTTSTAYIQGQYVDTSVREYFYFIDHQGQVCFFSMTVDQYRDGFS